MSKKSVNTILIILFCIITLAMPAILVQPAVKILGLKVSFLNTGNIGDTIGGITAPFIGILSTVLLYLTLEAQRKGNQQSNEEQSMSIFLTKLKILDQVVDSSKIDSLNISGRKIIDSLDGKVTEDDSYFPVDEFIPQMVKILNVLNMVLETMIDKKGVDSSNHFNVIFDSNYKDMINKLSLLEYTDGFLQANNYLEYKETFSSFKDLIDKYE